MLHDTICKRVFPMKISLYFYVVFLSEVKGKSVLFFYFHFLSPFIIQTLNACKTASCSS